MPERKPLDFQVPDLVPMVAVMAGLWPNQPETDYQVRLALTEAQQEICGMRAWKWLMSAGTLRYTKGTSTLDLYSACAGKFSVAGAVVGFFWERKYPLQEAPIWWIRQRAGWYTSARVPTYYWRFGEMSFGWWPIGNTTTSVHFQYVRRPGFVYNAKDVIIPGQWRINGLARLARRKVWEMRGDARALAPDVTLDAAIASLISWDEGLDYATPEWPRARGIALYHTARYSTGRAGLQFYSTNNLPP